MIHLKLNDDAPKYNDVIWGNRGRRLKMSNLDLLLDKYNKEHKNVISLGLPTYDYIRIPFSSPRMNYCTFGGIPLGKLVEFYGEEHGGKTTSALDIVGNYQKLPNAKKVLYVDAENTLDTLWAKKIGVDVDDIILYKVKNESAEEVFDFVCNAVETDEIGLVVIDSFPVLESKNDLEKDLIETGRVGGISTALTRFSNRAEKLAQAHQCTIIGINQIRDSIGSMFPMTHTPGGRAWRHNAAVRMEFRKGKYIDSKGNELNQSCENPAGNIVLMSMTKNKTCPPSRRTGTYTINYLTGVDAMRDLFDLAIKFGAVDKKGAWFTIYDLETGEVIKDKLQGQANAFEFLEQNTEIYDKLKMQIMHKLEETS